MMTNRNGRSDVDFILFWHVSIQLWSSATCSVTCSPPKASLEVSSGASFWDGGKSSPNQADEGASLFTSHGIRATHKYHGSHETPRTVTPFSAFFSLMYKRNSDTVLMPNHKRTSSEHREGAACEASFPHELLECRLRLDSASSLQAYHAHYHGCVSLLDI